MQKFYLFFFFALGILTAEANSEAHKLIQLSFRQDTQAVEQLFQEVPDWDFDTIAGFKKELQEALERKIGQKFNSVAYEQLLHKVSLSSQVTVHQKGGQKFYSYHYSTNSLYLEVIDWLMCWLDPFLPYISTWIEKFFPDLLKDSYQQQIDEYKEVVIQGSEVEPYRLAFEKMAFGTHHEYEIDLKMTKELLVAALQISGGALLLMTPYEELRSMGFFLIKDGFARGLTELKRLSETFDLNASLEMLS